jgi:hypothetical protein
MGIIPELRGYIIFLLTTNFLTLMMMNFGYGPGFVGGFGGISIVALVTWLVWITVGILLAVYLWKLIDKK